MSTTSENTKSKAKSKAKPKTAAKSSDGTCSWCLATPLYREYHDNEWGRPCTNSEKLFELINLEGAQAGLSWITILNKRENYRRAFRNFKPAKVAKMTDAQLEKLVLDPGIVRHRGKIEAVRGNALAYLDMQKNGEDFADFIWSFVDYKPLQNQPKTLKDVPAKTDISDALSKALKKRGFKFTGSTICYAFMQAAGLVNDHVISCPKFKPCAMQGKRLKKAKR